LDRYAPRHTACRISRMPPFHYRSEGSASIYAQQSLAVPRGLLLLLAHRYRPGAVTRVSRVRRGRSRTGGGRLWGCTCIHSWPLPRPAPLQLGMAGHSTTIYACRIARTGPKRMGYGRKVESPRQSLGKLRPYLFVHSRLLRGTPRSRLFWHDQAGEAGGDLRRDDHVALLDIRQQACAIHGVAEAGIPAIEQVLARRGQVGVEEQPEELR